MSNFNFFWKTLDNTLTRAYACSMMIEQIECLDNYDGECSGEVEYRFPLSGSGRSFPRCDKHWSDRLDAQDQINRRYAPTSDVAPVGFDPSYAGERWSDDY